MVILMFTPQLGARRTVVDEITHALRLAADGVGPQTLVLTAGPGSGKTHTLRQLESDLSLQSRWSTADELSWRQPYAVFSALVGVQAPEVVPPGFDAELLACIDGLCADRPHLFIVDDAHHADAGSLELLGRLAGAARDLPLILLVARRHLPAREMLTRMLSRRVALEWKLPPMDAVDLDALSHQVLGAWPDDRLAALLARSGGNPMHAVAILDNLRAQGRIDVEQSRATTAVADSDPVPVSLDEAIREQLALLDDTSRGLIQKLAVWGGPASLAELAAVDQSSPAALVLPAQTAVDAGVLVASGDGQLAFTHDVYADVTYEGVMAPLRSVLHTAIARLHEAAGQRQLVAHHLLAAGTRSPETAIAVSQAQQELSHAPAVAVDLLDTAVDRAPELSSTARTLELDLATALAQTGQLARAAEVAEQGLHGCTDLDTIGRLHRLLMFTLIAQGHTRRARDLIASTMQLPINPGTRAALEDVGRYIGVLEGIEPLSTDPFPLHEGGEVMGLVAESLRRFLSGDAVGGLELALLASRREADTGGGFVISTSADIWPPFIEQYVHGPLAAEALLDRATQLRRDRGAGWMTAYHEFTRGGISMACGRLDDAAASFDAGLERAEAADMGWTSLAEGGRATIDIYRGDIAAASTRLDAFLERGHLEQFGIPAIDHALMLLFEAQRKLRPAAVAARRCWTKAAESGLYGWMPAAAVDCARVAQRSGDQELINVLTADLDDLSTAAAGSAAGPVALALALCANDPKAIAAAAGRYAEQCRQSGDGIKEVAAWEESACAAARAGDLATARDHARNAFTLTQNMIAPGLSKRVASRLRPLGLRLDATAVVERPRTGWESLTRTEITVAELVAAGLSGGEIAARLYISPRTVQTHVSHALAKLGLRTRIDLATLVVGRTQR